MNLTFFNHMKTISFTCGEYFISTLYSNNNHSYQPEPGSVLLMGWIGNDFCLHSNQQILFQWSGVAKERQGHIVAPLLMPIAPYCNSSSWQPPPHFTDMNIFRVWSHLQIVNTWHFYNRKVLRSAEACFMKNLGRKHF